MIITCLDCGRHLSGNEDENGQVYVVCPFCHMIDLHLKMPDEIFGNIMLYHGSGNPNNNEYVMLTMLNKDNRIRYFVLSNAEVLHDGEQMFDAVQIYVAQTKKVGQSGSE